MRVLIPLLITLLLCGVIIFAARTVVRTLVQRQVDATQRGPIAQPSTAAIDPAAYRNHLGMARWIEGRLADDLVRSALDPDDDGRARQLLQEFYGEDKT